MPKSALVYVESPYQLINAVECLRDIAVSDASFMLRDNGNVVQNKQFQKIIAVEDIKNLRVYYCPTKSWLKLFFVIRLASALMFKTWTHSLIVTGAWQSIIVKLGLKWNSFKYKNIYLVDDGTILFSLLEKIKDSPFTLFSRMPLAEYIKSSGISKHSLKIKKQCSKKIKVIDVGVCFIGSPIVELEMFPQDAYYKVLTQIRKRHCDDALYYYAHRSENQENLSVVKRLGYVVVKPDLPLEDYLREHGGCAGPYYSFYSTAMINLSEMLPSSKFYAIRPSPNIWPRKDQNDIEDIYKFFRMSKIKVITENLEE